MIASQGTKMTEQKRTAFKKLIERHTRVNTVNRETARASLVREGISTQDGRLAPEYSDTRKLAARA
jgi:hypothetical protein